MAKKIKKITKAKLLSMARTAKRNIWKETADKIRTRDNHVCIVCGQPHPKLNVHHLSPREIKEYWLEPNNLVSLCPKCHKFSYERSFHRNPAWAFVWLMENRPEQWRWVCEKVKLSISS